MTVAMNDVLTLGVGLEEDGQGSKLQLHMPAGSETSGEENQDLDTASEVMSNSPGSETAKSVCVSGGAFSETGAATTRIMQGSMNTPVLVLTTTSQRGTVQASVLLDPSSSAGPWSSLQLSSLHSLAQANLISDTQQQIAKQLSAHHDQGEGGKQLSPHHQEGEGAKKGEGSKKEKRTGLRLRSAQKNSAKIRFTNDVRGEPSPGHKKQIAIFEPPPSEPKTFVCDYKGCGRKFAWLAHFKYHKLTHTNDRRYKCESCGKRFLTGQRLQVHMRTHTGERPFLCPAEDCGKSFTTAGNLKNHSRVHTGERPFVCEVDGCGRRFAEYSSLHKHSMTHSGTKPFTCEHCGKGFSQSSSRRAHMNRHQLEDAGKGVVTATLPHETLPADNDGVVAMDNGDLTEDVAVKAEPACDLLVLCNSHHDTVQFQDLQNAESVVFPQGLTDHIVTVTTQPAEGEAERLEMTHDILGTEVLVEDQLSDGRVGGSVVEDQLSDGRVGGSVVVLSQPSHMDSLHSPLSHSSLSHSPLPSLSHPYHQVATQGEGTVEFDDHSPLLHHLQQEEITPSQHHVLAYPPLDPSQHSHDAQSVAVEIEVGVSSSSSHPRAGGSIHMDPMMECDDEFDTHTS